MNKEYANQLARNIHALIASVEPHIPNSMEQEVEEQEREWKAVCDLLGLDITDPQVRAIGLAFMEYLLELLTAAEAGGQSEQAVALRGAATTLAIGVYGRDYLAAKKGD